MSNREEFEKVYPVKHSWITWGEHEGAYLPSNPDFVLPVAEAEEMNTKLNAWQARGELEAKKRDEELLFLTSLLDIIGVRTNLGLSNERVKENAEAVKEACIYSQKARVEIEALQAKRDDDLNRLNTIWIERYQQLEAKLAMQAEALKKLVDVCITQIGADYSNVIHAAYLEGEESLKITQADVDNWMARSAPVSSNAQRV